uniref:Uncharacterized protein n=1 Tax=uncultured Desulfobacterium sp. TaxID=201089 RepID=E1YE65_9BACT|nr:unknown protein [uncultured Desulfobacterium sp.]
MEETIESLEIEREHLYRQLQETGDFRRGIISVVYRKCGKKTAHVLKRGIQGMGRNIYGTQQSKGKATRRA